MKIVHCLGWYLPESVGGTEIYVEGLCRELQARGAEVVVMAARDGHEEAQYVHDGVQVIRYPVPLERTPDQIEGRAPHTSFEVFQRQLRELHADVFHIHAETTGCGAPHLAYAREIGLRTVTTVHVPGAVCMRGTMLRFGREVCDGRIDPRQCVPCWLNDRRMPQAIAEPLGVVLQQLRPALTDLTRGRVRSVLRSPIQVERSGERLREMAAHSDRVITVCAWLSDALLANGVPAAKLHACRQGVREVLAIGERGPIPAVDAGARLRVGYFGRSAHIKGLDVLVRAVSALPQSCAIELSVHAVASRDEDRACLSRVRALALADSRVRFLPPVPNGQVQQAMRQCDIVAVPSRWLETGPLVAMEALAAGIPVLGSDLGGLRELIEPGRTGWLLPFDDVHAWSEQLATLAHPGAARLEWTPDSTPVITNAEVAQRMLAIYREIGT
jgi:glycosyltransferase involved in cell wall biosynthesis